MGFGFPEAFLVLLVLPLLLREYRRANRRAGATLRAFRGTPPARWQGRGRLALLALFIGSLAAAGARPYVETRETGSFLFLVDVTRSMQARYACSEPTFLDRAKVVMREIIHALPEARFGIVAFDRMAFPITQLTYDRAYLEQVIEYGLNVGLTYDATATNLGNALSVVAGKKSRLPGYYGDVRHVILLSDGHQPGDYQSRLRLPFMEMEQADLRVAAVGIGNPGETPVPITSDRGECRRDHYTDIEGHTIQVPLRDDILSFIAAGTGGAYFGEGQVEGLVEHLRREGLVRIPEEAEAGAHQRRDASRGFIAAAALSLFGLLWLRTG